MNFLFCNISIKNAFNSHDASTLFQHCIIVQPWKTQSFLHGILFKALYCSNWEHFKITSTSTVTKWIMKFFEAFGLHTLSIKSLSLFVVKLKILHLLFEKFFTLQMRFHTLRPSIDSRIHSKNFLSFWKLSKHKPRKLLSRYSLVMSYVNLQPPTRHTSFFTRLAPAFSHSSARM